ncbi:MAG: hypothetical protein ACLQDC_01055 [Verrucomicrobiia bacterium]
MNSTRCFNVAKVLLLAMLAGGLSASFASAQEYQGKFTLPFEARWGAVTLPPGDYTFTFDGANYRCITVRQGLRGRGYVMVQATTDEKTSGSSAMIAVPTGGNYRIRMLHLAELDLTLYFAQPKAEGPVLAQAPVLNRRVPIFMASK